MADPRRRGLPRHVDRARRGARVDRRRVRGGAGAGGAQRHPAAAARRAADPLHVRPGLPARARPQRRDAAAGLGGGARRRARRLAVGGHPRVAAHRGGVDRDQHAHRRRRPGGGTRRPAAGGAAPGSPLAGTRARPRVPGDRRARRAGAPPGDGEWARAQPPALGRGGPPADRVGARPLLPDRRQPGRDPAGLKRRHPRLPLGREGERPDGVVLGSHRLRDDRAAARGRARAPHRGGRQPRQPAVRRGRGGDPDRQPARRGEEREPGLSRVPGERLQRRARLRAVPLGDRARARRGRPATAPGHPPSGSSWRRLPAPARDDDHARARPRDLRRADRHDAGTPGDLRDVRQLRRGRPPLRPRAARHAGGPAPARRAAGPRGRDVPPRAAAVRARRALRPRADAGRDVQAAQRLRARRPRRALALARAR